MIEQAELNRLFWHSRRGMLELDLLLVPFVQDKVASLDPTALYTYERLLEHEDTELFQWFLTTERPEDPLLADMVDSILRYNADRARQH
ncbi:succinate dehydrogenase assembly factor 2 [Allohahella marinimesophila]|uniref:FAD assembly factor SdhE n=1 Tax=Allohahella marinimesophila TaxID=1054972 RepID=A0ABP7Q4P5_9GAMM